jgi:hypothetical protein
MTFPPIIVNFNHFLYNRPQLSRTCCKCRQSSVRDQMETWRKVLSRHAGNSSWQLQHCRRHRLEFFLDDTCDMLTTCRNGYVLMKQKNDSVATVLRQSGGGGGGKGPLWGNRVCLFKIAASCLYRSLGTKLICDSVTTWVIRPYGKKHKSHSRQTLHGKTSI